MIGPRRNQIGRLRRARSSPLVLPLAVSLLLGAPARAQPAAPAATPARGPSQPPPDVTSKPRDPVARALFYYETGVTLFKEGNKEDALVNFRLAYELTDMIEALFMMAQSEYHLGKLKEARAHYQQYLAAPGKKDEKSVETAQLRIGAIEKRKGVLAINTDPVGSEVVLEHESGQVVTGQAPNNFELESGRWRVTVSKPNFRARTDEIAIDIAGTETRFFKLDPVPARLEIRTRPRKATLYVRGNRARNPYLQDVEPGAYEIYAEAPDYDSRREVLSLEAGERRVVDFDLRYVQRSGRPELIGFWTAVGAVAGGTAVLARLSTRPDAESFTASATVVAAGGVAGGIAGGIVSTAFVPEYIRDNLALFRIGAMWIGATEGASLALTFRRTLSTGWLGGAAGLGAGALAGSWLDARAPNYGRVALIQSAAAVGALAGALAVPALRDELDLTPATYAPRAVFLGLNLGLAAGLGLAYLPDQRQYGPSWQRVVLVDLAAAAGAFGGALVSAVGRCVQEQAEVCEFESDAISRARTAKFALVGGAVGLAAGWALTRGYDRNNTSPSEGQAHLLLPTPTVLPTVDRNGRRRLMPGLAAQGRF